MADDHRPFDHGMLNIPLAKRQGNIDAKIDRYKADQTRQRDQADTQRFHRVRAKKARVAQILAQMSDERVMALAAPLGSRKPETARAALASAANSNLDKWLASLAREVPFTAGACATCRAGAGDPCGCTSSEWLGPA